jgi:hypothetical protein
MSLSSSVAVLLSHSLSELPEPTLAVDVSCRYHAGSFAPASAAAEGESGG